MANRCEHFPGRFPSEILLEEYRLPCGMLDEVLGAKNYRVAKEMVDAAQTSEARQRLPSTPLFELVRAIDMTLAGEALAKRREEAKKRHGQ